MTRSETSRRDHSAVVQVQALPRIFQVRSLGMPDRLFLPLLKTARQAYAAAGCTDGTSPITPSQGFNASTYMLGLLCRDDTFTPGRPIETENVYSVDFLADVLMVRTECWATSERSVASFKVRFEGAIRAGYFTVHDPITGKRLMTFSEEDAARAHFFSEELPASAYNAKRYALRIAQSTGTAWLLQQDIDIRMAVPINGQDTLSVRLRKKESDDAVRIEDNTGNTLLTLQVEYLRDMDEVMNILKHQLASGVSRDPAKSPDLSWGEPVPGLSAKPFARNPLQESLLAMGVKLPSAISKFYELLFANHPEIAVLFQHADLERQMNKLLRAISAMSSSFEDPEQMTGFFQDLGSMYQAFGVKPEHMDFFSTCILGALKDAAGADWNHALAQHWSQACYKATEIMRNTMVCS